MLNKQQFFVLITRIDQLINGFTTIPALQVQIMIQLLINNFKEYQKMGKKNPSVQPKRKASIFVNGFRDIKIMKMLAKYLLQSGRIQYKQQLLTKEWSSKLLLLLNYCERCNKSLWQFIFDLNFKIQNAKFAYLRNRKKNNNNGNQGNQKLGNFYKNTMNYFNQNSKQLKQQRIWMKSLFQPFLPVIAIYLKLTNFDTSNLTKTNKKSLNQLFKKMLNGYDINKSFGITQNQTNFNLTNLIQSIVQKHPFLAKSVYQQNTQKNAILYEPQKYGRKKSGKIIIKKIKKTVDFSKTIAKLANIQNFFNRIFLTEYHPPKNNKRLGSCKRYDSKTSQYGYSTGQSSQYITSFINNIKTRKANLLKKQQKKQKTNKRQVNKIVQKKKKISKVVPKKMSLRSADKNKQFGVSRKISSQKMTKINQLINKKQIKNNVTNMNQQKRPNQELISNLSYKSEIEQRKEKSIQLISISEEVESNVQPFQVNPEMRDEYNDFKVWTRFYD